MLSETNGIRLIGKSDTAEVYQGSFYGVTVVADMLAVDPPWRQNHLTRFSNMAGVVQEWGSFVAAMAALIDRSNFRLVYIKCGVQELPEWKDVLGSMQHTHSWETNYSGGRNAQLLASNEIKVHRCIPMPSSKQATNVIAIYASVNGIATVADVCVGKGKMLKKFQDRGMGIVGIELCEDRAKEAAKRLGAE